VWTQPRHFVQVKKSLGSQSKRFKPTSNTKDEGRQKMKRHVVNAEQELAPCNIVLAQTSPVNHLNLIETHYEPKLHALSLD
jgi:hypothetical protein